MIEATQFAKKFKHIQPYYSKTSVEINNLIAVLIANGAGFDIRRMADISDMNLNDLVDEGLIVKEWDNILRILASLAMKATTQAVVVRKLSSYKRTNPTLKALIEFDKNHFAIN